MQTNKPEQTTSFTKRNTKMSEPGMITKMFLKQKLANIGNVLDVMDLKLKALREAEQVTASPNEAQSQIFKLELENQRLLKLIKEHDSSKLQLEKNLQAEIEKSEKARKEFDSNKLLQDRKISEMQKVIDSLKQSKAKEQTKPSPQQLVSVDENEELKRCLEKEREDHNMLKCVVQQLTEENRILKDSQRQETTIDSRQGPIKKEREKYDKLLKDFNQKVEECKSLEQKNNLLSCRIEDLKGAKVKTSADQSCQTEGNSVDSADIKKMTEQLKLEEQAKMQYMNDLSSIHIRHELMCSENDHLQRGINNLGHQINHLKKENAYLKKQLSGEKKNHEPLNEQIKTAAEEKKSLESLVEKLKTELNLEKEEREREVKNIEKDREADRKVFKETVEKCLAAYRAAVAKQ